MTQKKSEEVVKATSKTAAKPKIVENSTVKVTPKFSGLRFVAGNWYTFQKDKEIEVTPEAKRVLLEARAIYI